MNWTLSPGPYDGISPSRLEGAILWRRVEEIGVQKSVFLGVITWFVFTIFEFRSSFQPLKFDENDGPDFWEAGVIIHSSRSQPSRFHGALHSFYDTVAEYVFLRNFAEFQTGFWLSNRQNRF